MRALRDRHGAHLLTVIFCSICLIFLLAPLAGGTRAGVTLDVVSVSPSPHTEAPRTTSISIVFSEPVDVTTVDGSTVRVFGMWSGTAGGSISFSNGNATLTFTPSAPFSAGEVVTVYLSSALLAAGGVPLRPEGYAYQFKIDVSLNAGVFTEIAVMSNRIDGLQTRIYGASAVDVNNDGFCDLTTVNEVSADVRVFLSMGDGTAAFDDFLPPQGIGVEASPNSPGDFDNDGNADLCISATLSESVWVLLGNGDGTFGSMQEIPVGGRPHGIVAIDVDGDADMDIVVANSFSNDVALMINDGAGSFGAPTAFDSGVNGEYGLAAGDMDRDGILDLVVAGFNGQQLRTLLGNGDGTFTPAGPAQSSGGLTWVVVLDDVNGDQDLDVAAANSTSGNAAIIVGNGDGTFGTPALLNIGAHTVSADLGDLDGDGDADAVISSFGGGFWRIFENDGTGAFSFQEEITAPSNPSCAVLFDADNDGDLDMALTDEIADVVIVMRNGELVEVEPSVGLTPTRGETWNAPEPVTRETTIAFDLPAMGNVIFEVFDASGRRVLVRDLGYRVEGRHRVKLAIGETVALNGGVYMYRISSGAWSAIDRLVLAR